MQILGALTASCVSASLGIIVGYPGVALPQLEMSENAKSWFAAMDLIAALVFAPIGGLISGWLGRKTTMLIFSPITVIGWILLGISSSNAMVFAGRILSSSASCTMMSSPSAYIAEIAHPDIRAGLTSLISSALGFGLSLILILGYFCNYKMLACISTVPPLVASLMFWILPESPYWSN